MTAVATAPPRARCGCGEIRTGDDDRTAFERVVDHQENDRCGSRRIETIAIDETRKGTRERSCRDVEPSPSGTQGPYPDRADATGTRGRGSAAGPTHASSIARALAMERPPEPVDVEDPPEENPHPDAPRRPSSGTRPPTYAEEIARATPGEWLPADEALARARAACEEASRKAKKV